MNKIIYLNLLFAALLSLGTVAVAAGYDNKVAEPIDNLADSATPVIKNLSAESNDVLRQHAEYRRGLAQQERSTAANYLATGKSILQKKHLAIAIRQDAMADAYEKAVVVR